MSDYFRWWQCYEVHYNEEELYHCRLLYKNHWKCIILQQQWFIDTHESVGWLDSTKLFSSSMRQPKLFTQPHSPGRTFGAGTFKMTSHSLGSLYLIIILHSSQTFFIERELDIKRTHPHGQVFLKYMWLSCFQCPTGWIKSRGQAQSQCGREFHKCMKTGPWFIVVIEHSGRWLLYIGKQAKLLRSSAVWTETWKL